jgi:hypothetical protein
MVSADRLRLDEADTDRVPWRHWDPYLSERQWGTVREDYGSGDDTWSCFSREQARSRAYRWGKMAIGWSDHQSCANLAAWSWAGDRGGDWHPVVVNLSGRPAPARIPLDGPDLPGRSWQLTGILGPNVFERDGAELASSGLFADPGPWQFHLVLR